MSHPRSPCCTDRAKPGTTAKSGPLRVHWVTDAWGHLPGVRHPDRFLCPLLSRVWRGRLRGERDLGPYGVIDCIDTVIDEELVRLRAGLRVRAEAPVRRRRRQFAAAVVGTVALVLAGSVPFESSPVYAATATQAWTLSSNGQSEPMTCQSDGSCTAQYPPLNETLMNGEITISAAGTVNLQFSGTKVSLTGSLAGTVTSTVSGASGVIANVTESVSGSGTANAAWPRPTSAQGTGTASVSVSSSVSVPSLPGTTFSWTATRGSAAPGKNTTTTTTTKPGPKKKPAPKKKAPTPSVPVGVYRGTVTYTGVVGRDGTAWYRSAELTLVGTAVLDVVHMPGQTPSAVYGDLTLTFTGGEVSHVVPDDGCVWAPPFNRKPGGKITAFGTDWSSPLSKVSMSLGAFDYRAGVAMAGEYIAISCYDSATKKSYTANLWVGVDTSSLPSPVLNLDAIPGSTWSTRGCASWNDQGQGVSGCEVLKVTFPK